MSHYASLLEPIEIVWKRDPGQDIWKLLRIRRQSSSVFSCALIGCCVTLTVKDEGDPGKGPPSPAEYKEAHRASSNMVAYHLCILSWSALDFHRILCIWNQTLSQCCLAKSEGCRYISYFRIVEMKLISLVHRLSHKVIFLFCVWILPNPLLQIWNLPPHHFSLPTGFPCATLVAFFPLAFLSKPCSWFAFPLPELLLMQTQTFSCFCCFI